MYLAKQEDNKMCIRDSSYIAAAALLFAACANEEDGIGNNGPVAATVQADISNNIKTRGTADNNSWTAGDAIGVYVTSAGNTKGTNRCV